MDIWWLATSRNDGHCSYNELKYRKVLAQGWAALGDLSVLLPVKDEGSFKKLINDLAEYVYDGKGYKPNPGGIILNLLKFREGNLVVCTEGTSVKGIARVGANPTYRYDNGAGQHEYAQTIYPITEWKDWNKDIAGEPPHTGSMGPNGVVHYGRDKQVVLDAWEKLETSI
ncbi:MAG: hypothetical protein D3907_12695 [Candidatus Electrothrix sp. AUS3]|nr:hypothetical protein [Candidatus Electrothrix gigas]